MSEKTVRYKVEGPLAVLTLNRPSKLNAINTTMMADLNEAMNQAEEDIKIRAIVLQAEGKSFSAGFDLDDEVWEAKGEGELRATLEQDFDLIMRFWDSPKPTVSAVQGYCLGGGMEMALACAVFGQTVSYVFLDDGVYQLLKHQDARGIDSKTLGKALETLNLYGIENVCVDADSLSERGIQDSELVLDVKPVSRAPLVELIDQADTVFNL